MPCYVGASLCFVAVIHIGAPSGRPEMYYLAITKCCFESLTFPRRFFNLHYNVGEENIKAGSDGRLVRLFNFARTPAKKKWWAKSGVLEEM